MFYDSHFVLAFLKTPAIIFPYMDFLVAILPWVQIALSVLLVVTIILQQTGAGVGGAFGGSDGSINYTRRGFEKVLFRSSIILAILFALSTFASLVI